MANLSCVFKQQAVALALALLCSIDTLVTAKIMDKMTDGDNNHNRDLGANGVAAAAVALTGGVPGAMSTVPSVMMVKEGATSRLPGVMVGLFCLLGVFAFAPLFGYVPKAVFIGVLIVVGWQVLDTKPVLNLLRAHRENMRSRKLAWYDILLMKVVLAIILLVDMGTFIGIAVGTALHHTGNWLLKRKKRRAEALNNA